MVAVDADAGMAAIMRSWYLTIDMSLIASSYGLEATEAECMELISDSILVAEQLMSTLDVNPHHPPINHYTGPGPEVGELPQEGSDVESEDRDAGESSQGSSAL